MYMGLYAIGTADGLYVKIGITEGDPGVRLSTMQVGCPLELKVLAYRRDKGGAAERELHLAFSDYSVRGEWFRREGMVETWLDGFMAKHGKPEKWQAVIKKGQRKRQMRDAIESVRGIIAGIDARRDSGRVHPSRIGEPVAPSQPSTPFQAISQPPASSV